MLETIINGIKYEIIDCNTFIKKLVGLMFKKEKIDNIYHFPKCSSIHTFFMFQSIDICMTDKDNKIVYLKENLRPWHIIWPQKKAYHTYEMPLNTSKYLNINQIFKINS